MKETTLSRGRWTKRGYEFELAGPQGRPVRVTVEMAKAAEPLKSAAFQAGRRLVDRIFERVDDLKQCAVECLLDTYNDSWRTSVPEDEGTDEADEDDRDDDATDEDETDGDDSEEDELDETGFKARLTLTGVRVKEDLTADAYFDDGDLFAGHVIHVWLEAGAQPIEADIEG